MTDQRLVQSFDDALMLINVAERLHMLSEGILESINRDDDIEQIERQVETLHHQLTSLSNKAVDFKTIPVNLRGEENLPYLLMRQAD